MHTQLFYSRFDRTDMLLHYVYAVPSPPPNDVYRVVVTPNHLLSNGGKFQRPVP